MKILLLHAVDDPSRLRRTTLNQTFCLPKHLPGHDYTFHELRHDERPIAGERFDAILIDTTFLCYRWARPRGFVDELLARYDFVRRSDAIKIAFPQDDYDHCAVLDRWLSDWRVDVVFTPLERFADVLYPRTRGVARIEPCLTGYLDPVDRERLGKPAAAGDARSIDVGYRARALPPRFGRAGRLKSEIGRRFIDALPQGHGLRLDISTDPRDEIVGERWLDFLGDCRSFIGSASGSSLLDPEGRIKDAVDSYLERHPGATFEAVEAACFPGEDGRFAMTALGPRNLECAAAATAQILVPDVGLAPLEAGVHYIPIDADMRDIDTALGLLADPVRLRSITAAAAQLAAQPAFATGGFAARIAKCLTPRSSGSSDAPGQSVAQLALAERLILTTLERNAARNALITHDANLAAARGEALALREALRRRSGVRGALREALGLNRAAESAATRPIGD